MSMCNSVLFPTLLNESNKCVRRSIKMECGNEGNGLFKSMCVDIRRDIQEYMWIDYKSE